MSGAVRTDQVQRLRVRVRGTVQGVGFRPHIYRLARDLGLAGWVRNDGEGVLTEVQGAEAFEFVSALARSTPPMAHIDQIDVEPLSRRPELEFRIVESGAGQIATTIAPDAATCDDCLAELFDPADRRYRYPFLNCTNCGPRFTIAKRMPYDRRHTSMAAFPLCRDCVQEYDDPLDRRFHAQPTACAACGPALDTPLDEVLRSLQAGEILAIKGLGGFHLACDARNETAVSRLRRLKDREEKPFAVMAANLVSARALTYCHDAEAKVLTSPARPIVLLRAKSNGLAPSVAPGLPWLGVMLPYTPLHYLVFHEAAGRPDGTDWLEETQELTLVMTSANPGGEPLVIGNEEARRRLETIADRIVTHNRDIIERADDSVMHVIDGAPAFLRRARGFAPQPIPLAEPVRSVLAVGGFLKATICVTRGQEAFVSQHIGDLDNPEAIRFFEESVDHLLQILAVTPEVVAHDLHPDFPSTRYAFARGLPTVGVQHHHAHIAAVVAEHRVTGPVIGVALDGFGLGEEGAAWGGELLRVEGAFCERLGHLAELPQPGGDMAARQPWRMGAAALHRLGRGVEIAGRYTEQNGAPLIAQMLAKGVNSPLTSSGGRLFDAACGLLGIQPTATFEGQAPIRLEALVTAPVVVTDGWRIQDGTLDLLPLLARLADTVDPVAGANLFHGTLTAALADWIERSAAQTGLRTVALGGGCFLNRVLIEGLVRNLKARGFLPLIARRVPPNDGGLSLGQAWVAAQQPA